MTPEEQRSNELEVRKGERREKIKKLYQLHHEKFEQHQCELDNEKITNECREIQSQINKIEDEDAVDIGKFNNSMSL